MVSKYIASPGSKAAIAMGCICPSKDNNNGMGFILSGHKVFYMRDDCPIHSANTLQEYVNRRVLEGAHDDEYYADD